MSEWARQYARTLSDDELDVAVADADKRHRDACRAATRAAKDSCDADDAQHEALQELEAIQAEQKNRRKP